MSEQNTPTDPQTAPVVVTDPDDYNRQQRFKEIHDARQRVTDFVAMMELSSEDGMYLKSEAKRLAYLVSLYIMELEPLIVRSDVDDGELVGDGGPFGSLVGFASFMGMKRPGGDTVSPAASMSYFSAANKFFARVGMGLELDQREGDAGFDYSDILEEGPPGTGDAPQLEADGRGDEAGGDE